MASGLTYSLSILKEKAFKEYPDRKVYSLNQTNFPLGFGIRYEVKRMLNVRAECIVSYFKYGLFR